MNRQARIFWRVYRHGLLVLVAAIVSFSLVAALFGALSPWRGTHPRARDLLVRDLSPILNSPSALKERVQEFYAISGLSITVYGSDGKELAREGDHLLPLSSTEVDAQRASVLPRWMRGPVWAASLNTDGAHVVVQRDQRALWRPVAGLAAVLMALALASIPFARAVSKPIEELTSATRKFGDGKLSTRVAREGMRGEADDLALAFNQMASRIERLVEGGRDLLANVSHELRTPLSRIGVALELCEEQTDQAALVEKHLVGIRGDIAELNDLIDDVLMATRLDVAHASGMGVLRRHEVATNELLDAAQKKFRERFSERELVIESGDPSAIIADPVMFRRVLDNILENAARYGDSAHPVELKASIAEARVCFEVLDRGDALTDADFEHLFEPFFRGDRSRARSRGGVGLGLYLCKRIVEAHEGAITAELRSGGGLRVRVWMAAA